MKTSYYTASSLDGFIATEDHALDWLLQFGEVEGSTYPGFIHGIGALAMGSSTYAWLLKHHLKLGSPGGEPWPYAQPVWVFTHRELPAVPGADLRFVRGNVRPVHQQMVQASAGKDLWVVGGGDLAGQFFDAGLLDELVVQIAPVTLGRGLPLFPRRLAFPPLQLEAVTPFGKGFVELRYAVPKEAK